MHGILKLRAMIQEDPAMGWRERYNAVGTEELVGAETAGPGVNVTQPGGDAGA
jgi:NADH-quinone oxidoreductase subunit B